MATIEVDEVERTYTVEEGAGDIVDVVLVFCGSGTTGSGFLTQWTPGTGWAFIAPDPLEADGGAAWVIPGLPEDDDFYPEDAPSDEHDHNVVAALVALAQEDYPGCRIWFAGFSKGASLGWSCLAHGMDGICGYFLASFGAPLASFYTSGDGAWGFDDWVAEGRVDPKAVAFWHGGLYSDTRSQTLGGADTFGGTAELLQEVCGRFGTWQDVSRTFGHPRLMMRQAAQHALIREYESQEGAHRWDTDVASFAVAFFEDVVESVAVSG